MCVYNTVDRVAGIIIVHQNGEHVYLNKAIYLAQHNENNVHNNVQTKRSRSFKDVSSQRIVSLLPRDAVHSADYAVAIVCLSVLSVRLSHACILQCLNRQALCILTHTLTV